MVDFEISPDGLSKSLSYILVWTLNRINTLYSYKINEETNTLVLVDTVNLYKNYPMSSIEIRVDKKYLTTLAYTILLMTFGINW